MTCRRFFRPSVVLTVVAMAACAQASVVGVWTGRDEQQRLVTYSFAPDGTGHRTVAGVPEPLTYEITVGYPNLIRIEVESEGRPEVSQGLVQLIGDSQMRLELADPGAPAPRQVSSSALVLQRLPTK